MASETNRWDPCLADQYLGVAFFDGIRIDTDKITDPRWDRVLPILEEEQIFMCRLMTQRQVIERVRANKVSNDEPLRILDVGTGSGVFAIWAACRGCHVTALDISPRALRYVNHNAHLEGNRVQIEKANGRIDCVLEDIYRFKADRPYDLVFLAPPYNPTLGGIKPALHADAGQLGQKHFVRQLLRVLRDLLVQDGLIVGNQMLCHQTGSLPDYWKNWTEHFSKKYHRILNIETCSIIEGECFVHEFLEEQYKQFLHPGCKSTKTQSETERNISDFVRSVDQQSVFGLYYYEVGFARAGMESKVSSSKVNIYPPCATWNVRKELHRTIVEHTSQKERFNASSLFLANGFSPKLPDGSAFEALTISSILKWIEQSRLLTEQGFEIVLVDVGPWFDVAEGRDEINNEALLCLVDSDKRCAKKLLENYQKNTICLQNHHIGPFFHPVFTGARFPKDWRGVQYHIIDKCNSVNLDFSDSDSAKVLEWVKLLRSSFSHVGLKNREAIKDVADAPSGIVAAYATETLKNLGVPSVKSFVDTIYEQCGCIYNDTSSNSNEKLCHDLQLRHACFHKRLREIMLKNPDEEQQSVLIGVPLALAAVDVRFTNANDLPTSFRGGFWIFAASSKLIGPAEESYLFDLARLTFLLAQSANATNAINGLKEAIGVNKRSRQMLLHLQRPLDALTKAFRTVESEAQVMQSILNDPAVSIFEAHKLVEPFFVEGSILITDDSRQIDCKHGLSYESPENYQVVIANVLCTIFGDVAEAGSTSKQLFGFGRCCDLLRKYSRPGSVHQEKARVLREILIDRKADELETFLLKGESEQEKDFKKRLELYLVVLKQVLFSSFKSYSKDWPLLPFAIAWSGSAFCRDKYESWCEVKTGSYSLSKAIAFSDPLDSPFPQHAVLDFLVRARRYLCANYDPKCVEQIEFSNNYNKLIICKMAEGVSFIKGGRSTLSNYIRQAIQYRDDLGSEGDFLSCFGALIKKGLGIASKALKSDSRPGIWYMVEDDISLSKNLLHLGRFSHYEDKKSKNPFYDRHFKIMEDRNSIILYWGDTDYTPLSQLNV